MSHALERISPKGTPFVGKCMKCGRDGLRMGDALKDCPADEVMSDEAALLRALKGSDE